MVMIMDTNIIDQAFNNYFGIKDATIQHNQQVINEQIPEHSSRTRMAAYGNVDNIDQLGEILRKLLNAAWGSNWGIIVPDTYKGEDAEQIFMPQINYSMNLREVSDGTSPKPQLMDTINEVVNGKNTGDAFQVYRQTFDCIVEFDFFDNTSLGCRSLMSKFESLLATYTGYLKQEGVKDIYFLKEVPANYSLNYIEGVPMKCLYFFVRLERNKSVRVSTMRQIEQRLTAMSATGESTEQNSDDIKTKITYNL
jgi:hypothetical protein